MYGVSSLSRKDSKAAIGNIFSSNVISKASIRAHLVIAIVLALKMYRYIAEFAHRNALIEENV